MGPRVPRLTRRDTDMSTRLYSDQELAELKRMPKRVTNPRARWSNKPGHKQRNYEVRGRGGNAARFSVYLRQSLIDDSNFSCGIAYIQPGERRLTLARYNGPSHRHGDIHYRPHIHRATAGAIAAGRKPESEADETDRFEILEGALRCLIGDYHLEGLDVEQHEERRLPL